MGFPSRTKLAALVHTFLAYKKGSEAVIEMQLC